MPTAPIPTSTRATIRSSFLLRPKQFALEVAALLQPFVSRPAVMYGSRVCRICVVRNEERNNVDMNDVRDVRRERIGKPSIRVGVVKVIVLIVHFATVAAVCRHGCPIPTCHIVPHLTTMDRRATTFPCYCDRLHASRSVKGRCRRYMCLTLRPTCQNASHTPLCRIHYTETRNGEQYTFPPLQLISFLRSWSLCFAEMVSLRISFTPPAYLIMREVLASFGNKDVI